MMEAKIREYTKSKYVIISTAKDEENYIEDTIESVVNQTIRPATWVIVDDGSQDRTPEVVSKYCEEYNWIKLVRIERGPQRQPGSAVINAFNQGCKLIKDEDFEFIVKLDCDLRFDPYYFEQLFLKFHQDERLGIASGIYLENRGKAWIPVKMPDYHVAGACKAVREKCFKEIGGFISSRGWDTVDEIKAQMMGWRTSHFTDLQMYHLKNEGSGTGQLRTNAMLGEIFYLTGGSKLFFVLKVLHRLIVGKPFIGGGLLMAFGYLKPMIQRKKLLVSHEEAIFYRNLLNKRIFLTIFNLVLLRNLFPSREGSK